MRRRATRSIWLGLVLLLGCVVAVAQAPAKGKTVRKSGVVEAGVENGCLVVRDTKDHKLYNVLIKAKDKPAVGATISFTGTLHEGPTTCMQGIAVDVSSWKLVKGADPKLKNIAVP